MSSALALLPHDNHHRLFEIILGRRRCSSGSDGDEGFNQVSDLEKVLWVPKRKRSKLSNWRRTDLLPFCVPKKKRTTITMKRKRSGDHDDDDQIQRPKRQKTTTPAHDLGSFKTNSLWSFQRISEFRFCPIKIHHSTARTTMVS